MEWHFYPPDWANVYQYTFLREQLQRVNDVENKRDLEVNRTRLPFPQVCAISPPVVDTPIQFFGLDGSNAIYLQRYLFLKATVGDIALVKDIAQVPPVFEDLPEVLASVGAHVLLTRSKNQQKEVGRTTALMHGYWHAAFSYLHAQGQSDDGTSFLPYWVSSKSDGLVGRLTNNQALRDLLDQAPPIIFFVDLDVIARETEKQNLLDFLDWLFKKVMKIKHHRLVIAWERGLESTGMVTLPADVSQDVDETLRLLYPRLELEVEPLSLESAEENWKTQLKDWPDELCQLKIKDLQRDLARRLNRRRRSHQIKLHGDWAEKLLGREDVLRALDKTLDIIRPENNANELDIQNRLFTLYGPAQVGKTCLALQLAERIRLKELANQPGLEIRLVELKDKSEDTPECIAYAIVETLNIPPAKTRIIEYLCGHLFMQSNLLLILDHCDYVKTGVAKLIEKILSLGLSHRQVTFLATSRERLFEKGHFEYAFRIPPLKEGEQNLFIEERRKADVGQFSEQLESQNAEGVIAYLCSCLDNLPGLIKIVIGRPPDELLKSWKWYLAHANLDVAYSTLKLDEIIRPSYCLLDVKIQQGFRKLAIFEGEILAEDAIKILELSENEWHVLVTVLLSKNMLLSLDLKRYRMLNTVRAFAWRLLADPGDRDEKVALEGKHSCYYLDKIKSRQWSDLDPNMLRALDLAIENGKTQDFLECIELLRLFVINPNENSTSMPLSLFDGGRKKRSSVHETIANFHYWLGSKTKSLHEYLYAQIHYRKHLDEQQSVRNRESREDRAIDAIEALAATYAQLNLYEQAAYLFGYASKLRDNSQYKEIVDLLKANLGKEYISKRDAGKRVSDLQALRYKPEVQ